jgi:hypothetical protein
VSWADVSTHLIAAALPLLLYGTYALFRRLYIRALERAIYAPTSGPIAVARSSIVPVTTSAAPLRWNDARTQTDRAEPAAAADARRENVAVRRAYAASGGLFVLLGAALVYFGLSHNGMSWRAAIVIADLNTFVGLMLVLMFVRPRLPTVLLTVALWVAFYFTLTVGAVRTSWSVAAGVLISNVPITMSLPLVLIGPFALRTMRPLVVAFVPVFTLIIVLTTALVLAFELLDVPMAGDATVRSMVGGAAAFVVGVTVVVRRIRRGMQAGFVAGWMAGTIGMALALWQSGSLIAGFLTGIFINGTLVLVAWVLLRLFLQLKARGYAPSETLHYIGCWVLYAVTIAPAAQLDWNLLPALVFALIVTLVVLHVLLLRGRRPGQTPKRMLLLRVFKQVPIRSWLMDLLDDTWRRVGRIDTVVGLDLALHTLNAFALEDFLRGRVRRQFLKDSAEVRQRVATLPSALGLDRRYPLNELHCLPDTWQEAVTALLDGADVVLIDLRGVQSANRGVLYELALAMRHVPLQRLVLIADTRTDAALVGQVVSEAQPPSSLDVLVLTASPAVNARAVTNAVFAAAA